MAPLEPVPEIVGKLKDLKFLLFFLNFSNFSWALISLIFLFLKLFFNQNKNLTKATPSYICVLIVFLISTLFLIALKR